MTLICLEPAPDPKGSPDSVPRVQKRCLGYEHLGILIERASNLEEAGGHIAVEADDTASLRTATDTAA